MSLLNNLYSIRKLLDLVKSRPAIYNNNLGEYNNREHIENLWQEIAFEMQTTPHICKNKWSSLRSGYTRHVRNEKQSLTTSGFGKMKKKWYLADYMSFLRNYICYKRFDSPTNLTDESLEAKNDSTLGYDSNSFSSAQQDAKNENADSQENDNCIEINSDSSQSAIAEDEHTSDDIANYFKDSFTLKRSRPEESGDQIETFFNSSTPHHEYLSRPSVAQPSNDLENRLNEPSYSKRSRHEKSDNLRDESIAFSAANKEIDRSAVTQPPTLVETQLKESPYPKRTSQQENELEEQNMAFFTSILPDISKLSERKRRLFKQEILLRLNKSLDEQETEGGVR